MAAAQETKRWRHGRKRDHGRRCSIRSRNYNRGHAGSSVIRCLQFICSGLTYRRYAGFPLMVTDSPERFRKITIPRDIRSRKPAAIDRYPGSGWIVVAELYTGTTPPVRMEGGVGETVKLCVTVIAAEYWAFPFWLAVTEQVPGANKESMTSGDSTNARGSRSENHSEARRGGIL
jgi:hypothetical protein